MLPEGQDPDDLVRSGGAPAIAEALGARRAARRTCCSRARRRATPSTRRKNAPASSGGCASSSARSPTRRCAAITRPTWRAGSAISRLWRAAPPPRSGRRERYPARRRDGSAVRTPGRGSASPAPRCRPRRAASSPSRREAPREIAILAILIGHPGLLEKRIRGGGGARIRSAPRSPRLRDRLLALPGGGLRRGRRPGGGARGGGAGRRPRTHPVAGRRHGQLVVPRARGGSLGRRTRFAPDSGLATKFGALNRELKLAEQALAADPTEQNFARLRDIKANLADLANAEAAIEDGAVGRCAASGHARIRPHALDARVRGRWNSLWPRGSVERDRYGAFRSAPRAL